MGLIKSTVITLALALLAGGAMAQRMSPENVARLGKDLNPIGGIKAGSEDGLIPQWTGNVVGLPAGLKWDGPGTTNPDPWPQEQPLFVISADNLDPYRARLSPGQIAMFETYPDTFRMPVYPGHREFAYYPQFYQKVLYNAEHAQLVNDNEGITGFVGGAAFVVPSNGPETIWFTRTTGAFETMDGEYSDIAVFPNGTRSTRRSRFLQESPYASRSNPITAEYEYPKLGEYAGYIMTYVTEPARDKVLIN